MRRPVTLVAASLTVPAVGDAAHRQSREHVRVMTAPWSAIKVAGMLGTEGITGNKVAARRPAALGRA